MTALTAARVKSRATSARGVRKLLGAGARISSLGDLHAKIYVFDDVAFVGSANASESSTDLQEAAVVLEKRSEVESARSRVAELWDDASPIDDRYVRELVKLEPASLPGERVSLPRVSIDAPRVGRRQSFRMYPGRVWISAVVGVEVDEAVLEARSKKVNQLIDSAYIPEEQAIKWTSLSRETFRTIPEEHLVFVWWQPTSRSPYGRLEGPLKCLSEFDLGKGLPEGRYSRAEDGRFGRVYRLDPRAIEVISSLVPRARIARSRKHAEHLNDRLWKAVCIKSERDLRALRKLLERLPSRRA